MICGDGLQMSGQSEREGRRLYILLSYDMWATRKVTSVLNPSPNWKSSPCSHNTEKEGRNTCPIKCRREIPFL